MADTWKIERVYSPVEEAAVAIGKKPATVTMVPVNIGTAVELNANEAAFILSQPCSILDDIISTAIMASSTNKPSASINAPSEILCKPMSYRYITKKVADNTTGIEIATTMPVLKPNDKRLTANTITKASINEPTKSFTEAATILDCDVTVCMLTPTGRLLLMRAIFCVSASPKAITSPPCTMLTPINNVSLPL